MRKALGMVLFCLAGAAAPVGAQQPGARTAAEAEARTPDAVSTAVLQQQVNELWTTVRRLEARVDTLQRTVEELQAGGAPAVGGGGTAGTAAQVPVARSTFVGRVRAVTDERVQVVDARGNVYALTIDEQTRAFGLDGEPMSVQALPEGTPVQTSLVLISGRNHARDIRVLDAKEIQRGEDARRQPRW